LTQQLNRGFVQGVLGPIDAERLGATLVHEHLTFRVPGSELDARFVFDREAALSIAQRDLDRAASSGLKTLVDATPIEMGRDPQFLAEVAKRTGVNVVCATGLYNVDYGVPTYFRNMSSEEIAAWYVRDLVEGIDGTDIRAGVIKVATAGAELLPLEETILRAAALASIETNTSIVTHTSGAGGDVQARFLLDQGVDPTRLGIGHVDHKDSTPRYLEKILKLGVFLTFDRVGYAVFLSESLRAGLLAGLIDAGYHDQLLLSMDAISAWQGPSFAVHTSEAPFSYLLDGFVERLFRFGLTRESVDHLLVSNAGRFLTGPNPGPQSGEAAT
jgi:phosphotriesterase-related protein